ncbi:MAG: MarR family transcriptional regulator [Synergistaceae bacterium]|nr:MarR family transcriptional regulator [Synergistaceae bacterium]
MHNHADKIAILIKKLSLEIDKLSNPILEPHDLTNSQFKILKFLLVSPENSVRQVDVERYFSMTNPTVTGLVQVLEKKGLIERKINPDDSRSKILCPTQKTLAMKDLLYQLGDELEGKLTSVLTPDEKDTLMNLLKKLLHHHG